MEDKNNPNTSLNQLPNSDSSGALSSEPTQVSDGPNFLQPNSVRSGSPPTGFGRFVKRFAVVMLIIFLLGIGGIIVGSLFSGKGEDTSGSVVAGEFNDTEIPLADIPSGSGADIAFDRSLAINGPLAVNDTFVLAPQAQPVQATAGQLYFDQDTSALTYYNGTEFVELQGNNIVSVTSGSSNVNVTDDGNGNLVISSTGGGTGTVTSGGGTAGRIAKFTSAQNLENSLLSESGAVVTVNGDLNVSGGVTLATPLSVSSGGIGTNTLAVNGVIVGNGTAALTSVTAGAAGLCFMSNAGAPSFQACPGGGGGANTALSNLAGVAINTTLLPGAAGTINLGSATLPFGDVFLAGTSGTPGTNNFRITGASTGGTRTITLPDATGTVCLQNSAACGFLIGSGSAFVNGGNSFGGATTLGTNDGNDLAIERGGTTQLTVGNGVITLASNVDLLMSGASAYISNPQASFANGEAFGLNASAGTGSNTVVVGNAATVTFGGSRSIVIGQAAGAAGDDSIALGYQASATSSGGLAIGSLSRAGFDSIAIGYDSDNVFGESIALGQFATATASNQLVVGSNDAEISNVYFGSGVTDATPTGFRLQATGGSGANVAGANLDIAGGQGTGSANGGGISFLVSPPGGAGSGSNALLTVGTIQGGTGAVNFINTTNSTQGFNIETSAGGNLFTVDTINSAIGINLGSNNVPALDSGLEVNGSVRISGVGVDDFTTPNGGTVDTDFGIAVQTLSDFDQVMALGLSSTSQTNARVLTLFDDRAGAHQPSMAIISPNENEIAGLSWDGSDSAFLLKNSNASGTIALNIGGSDKLTATTAGATVTGVLSVTALGTASNATFLCHNGSNQIASCNTTGAGAAFINGGNSFGGATTLGTNDANDLAIERNNVTQLTVGNGVVTFASNVDLTLQGITAYMSNPQTQTRGEAFGATATVNSNDATAVGAEAVANNRATAVGSQADAAGNNSVAIGNLAVTAANDAISIGTGTLTELGSIAIGQSAIANHHYSVALGAGASTGTQAHSIAIGAGATATATNQLVIGADAGGGEDTSISQVYIGDGVTSTTPNSVTINGTGGSGTDIAGASITIAGGRGTGTGNGGTINLQIADPGTTGSSLNALATVLSLSGTNGAATFQNTTDSATGFRVLNAAGTPHFVVDTTNTRVYIGDPSADATGALLVLDTKNNAGDPTGVLGAMYYNSNRGKMRCFELDNGSTGFWRDCIYSPRTSLLVTSDFTSIGGDSNFQFGQAGTGSGHNALNIGSVAGHPGIDEQDTGTTTTGRAAVISDALNGILLGNNDTYRFEAVIRIPTLSDGTETYTYRSGFLDSQTADSTDGCYFRYTHSVNSGEWEGVCRSSTTESTCDTNIAVTANTWYRLNVAVNSGGTSADFLTDGTSRCTIATNIPTGAGRGTGFGSAIIKSAGTTARTVHLDYMEIFGQLNTPR